MTIQFVSPGAFGPFAPVFETSRETVACLRRICHKTQASA